MMKKILLILLACTLCLSGCSGLSGPASDAASSMEASSASTVPENSRPTDSRPPKASSEPKVPSSSETVSRLPSTVTVTIPEGYSMTQIFRLLEENHVASFDRLLETAQSYDYTYYPLVDAIRSNPNRCFLLEGYLFPDTYQFYTRQKPQDAIGIFLRNAEKKLSESLRIQAEDIGYSVDEILTIASIIEKECGKKSEMRNVSAVLHNRLNSGMKLQCDVTIHYVERYLKPYLKGDVNRYNSYYNTYKCDGLPAGPICSPGMTAIKAALDPADSSALYFVTDAAGNYYYADDYETHQQNCQAAGIELK